jgi:hypothetical protein
MAVAVSGPGVHLKNPEGSMADKKDVLLVQIVHAFAQGLNSAEIGDDVAGWFHERYAGWIVAPATNPEAKGTSPLDVWDEQGKKFLAKFRDIGQQVADGGATAKDALEKAAAAVEGISDCPWCPISN